MQSMYSLAARCCGSGLVCILFIYRGCSANLCIVEAAASVRTYQATHCVCLESVQQLQLDAWTPSCNCCRCRRGADSPHTLYFLI